MLMRNKIAFQLQSAHGDFSMRSSDMRSSLHVSPAFALQAFEIDAAAVTPQSLVLYESIKICGAVACSVVVLCSQVLRRKGLRETCCRLICSGNEQEAVEGS